MYQPFPKLTISNVNSAFEGMGKIAQQPNIPYEEIYKLVRGFLKLGNYYRTMYRMNFGEVQRARLINAGTIEEVENILWHKKELSHPPVGLPKLGRCNTEGRPVFYCSNENGVPIFEVRPEVGQYIVVTRYEHQRNLKICLDLPIIGVKAIMNTYQKRDSSHEMIKILRRDMHFKSVSVDGLLLEIDDKLSDWYTKDVSSENQLHYRLTAAVYQIFVDDYNLTTRDGRVHKLNGMIYPSVSSELTGYNIALEPDYVKKNLKPVFATLYRVEFVKDKYIRLLVLKELNEQNISRNGKLTWVPAENEGKYFELTPETPTVRFPFRNRMPKVR